METQSPAQSENLSKIFGILFAALFHIAVILMLLRDHVTLPLSKIGQSVVVQLLEAEANPPESLELPPPSLKMPPISIESPQIEISLGTPVVSQPMVTIGARFAPDIALSIAASEYSANLRKFARAYSVDFSVQVLTDGRVGDIYVEKNGGDKQLENSIITYARTHWRFIPSTSDGVAVMGWKTVHVAITPKEMLVRN